MSKTEDEAVEIQDRSPQLAAISSFRFPLHFTGTNWLLDNAGGGLSAMGTVVRVNGSLFVHNNTANNGGGIHLEDLCLVRPCLCLLYTYVCAGCICALIGSIYVHACVFMHAVDYVRNYMHGLYITTINSDSYSCVLLSILCLAGKFSSIICFCMPFLHH